MILIVRQNLVASDFGRFLNGSDKNLYVKNDDKENEESWEVRGWSNHR